MAPEQQQIWNEYLSGAKKREILQIVAEKLQLDLVRQF